VTDADLVLGRIPPDASLPGIGVLDVDAARSALARIGVTAADVVTVVDAAMVEAIRVVSVQRGVDPAALALVAFGGAGPLHACALADELGMAAVLVPARAGVFSAVGLVAAPRQRDLVHSWPTPLDHRGLDAARTDLVHQAAAMLTDQSAANPSGGQSDTRRGSWVDCRYAGQSHELTVAEVADFHDEHRRRNGYSRPDDPVEVIALRARAEVASPVDPAALPTTPRSPVTGPAVVAEPDCTIWVPAGWHGEVGAAGAYVLRRVR
jgi:N-methylhydantoinase A/oxoprolinase/acetone carboxylase beta subunit